MIKQLFSVNGRIKRSEYIFYWILCVGGTSGANRLADTYNPIILLLIILFLGFLLLVQGTKRCNDLFKPWWSQLIPFYFLWMMSADGDPRISEDGPNPKGLKKAK